MSSSAQPGVSGYLHRSYAESFAEFAKPRHLPRCGGWILEREIPGSTLRDAMGCWPIFACREWSRLAEDLEPLADQLVSLTLVTDPFGGFDEELLRAGFELVRPFKQHHVVDLDRRTQAPLPRRHRRNVATARERVRVEVCERPGEHLDEWVDLYGELIARHGITGMRRFSRAAFARQLAVPGLIMLRASVQDAPVGLHLWYAQGDVAYGHLGATNQLGYESMASYALYAYAIELLRSSVRWLYLGAAAGLEEGGSSDGLRAFKAGWATGTRPAYLCGRILQPEPYAELTRSADSPQTSYFPSYRAGEFGPTSMQGETSSNDRESRSRA